MSAEKRLNKDNMFWTDYDQAQERLNNSCVLYDGAPFLVAEIRRGDNYEDGVPRITGIVKNKPKTTRIDDEKFKKYRTLPRVGWINCVMDKMPRAYLIERRARTTRTHGLSNHNCTVFVVTKNGIVRSDNYNATNIFTTTFFAEAQSSENYPALAEIIQIIEPNTSIAYSPKFCVYRCANGVRWLYRGKTRIGYFTGVDSLSLFPKQAFFKEEIMEDPNFTLNNIQEF